MTDDEITREVDPAWLASVTSRRGTEVHDDDSTSIVEADSEPEFDDESTIAADDLLDRVRDAVQRARLAAPSTLPPPITSPAITSPAITPRPTAAELPPPPRALAPAEIPPLEIAPPELQPPGRWAPPPRLKPALTPTTAALVDEPARRRTDSRVVIAIVVAVLIGVAVGLFVATRGSDTPAPTDDSVVDTGVVDTGVVDTGAGAGVTPSSAAATFTPDGDAGGDQP